MITPSQFVQGMYHETSTSHELGMARTQIGVTEWCQRQDVDDSNPPFIYNTPSLQ